MLVVANIKFLKYNIEVSPRVFANYSKLFQKVSSIFNLCSLHNRINKILIKVTAIFNAKKIQIIKTKLK